MSERAKFLVTGGLGFIGQCVVRNLLQRGIPAVTADHTPIPRRKPHFVLQLLPLASNLIPCLWT